MWSSFAIAVVLAVSLMIGLVVIAHMATRLFGPRCLKCGHRPIDRCDGHVFYDPAPSWSLFCCPSCGSEFIRSSGQLTPRLEWNGDPDAEQTFQELELESRA